MIAKLRARFNRDFRPEQYARLLARLEERCRTPIPFRNSETPCFFERELLDRLADDGRALIEQLVGNPDYLTAAAAPIPSHYRLPHPSSHPLFIQVDFGLTRDPAGEVVPRLVEIQGFPSLYAYQPLLVDTYREVYGLEGLEFLLDGLHLDAYRVLLGEAIVGSCDPENVVLLDIAPSEQKTYCDFLETERLFGVKAVCITKVEREGRRLYYRRDGRRIPIVRIYNRAVPDELDRKGVRAAFAFSDDLDVEWAGHLDWFYLISKFSLPYLNHPSVPRTWFLNQLDSLPDRPENFVLKPLYSFAGLGVSIGPSRDDLARIPEAERGNFILQERIDFAPLIETPAGPTKAEVRVMYIWTERLRPCLGLVRMGRGKMMGVDYNLNMDWVGASAALYPSA